MSFLSLLRKIFKIAQNSVFKGFEVYKGRSKHGVGFMDYVLLLKITMIFSENGISIILIIIKLKFHLKTHLQYSHLSPLSAIFVTLKIININ